MNKTQTEQFLITSLSSPFHHLHFSLRQPIQLIYQLVYLMLLYCSVGGNVLLLLFEDGFDQ